MPVSELRIEPMLPSHIDEVLAIETVVFPTPWTRAMFEQEVGGNPMSRAMVALRGRTVVGYIIPWFLFGEVHLLNLAVAVSQQRRGVGALLLAWLIERAVAERREFITLEVRRSNYAARHLYAARGFRDAGVRKRYYQDNHEDALIMVLDLRDRIERAGRVDA